MACQNPQTINGATVSCKRCNHCVGRRVHNWCVRAMMERETMGHALVLALTYNEETEESRRSARVFDYTDVQNLLKNIRRQVEYHLGRTSAVSFIAAGEKGERFNRCHWHLVLFSEVDLTTIGKWSAPWGPVSGRSEIITPPHAKPAWRRGWSLWPQGFVTVQEPDYSGMRYALAYALKDQFNGRNAEFTARQAKSETFAQGYLVMSKKPAIGARWIDAYVEKCRAAGVVPPSKRVKVDGVDKPWWPSGLLAQRLLAGLAAVNREVFEATGQNGAGWSTLLHEVRDSDDDLETLGVIGHGEEIEEKPVDRDALFGLRSEEKRAFVGYAKKRREFVARKTIGGKGRSSDAT